MNKSELVDAVAENAGLSKADAVRAVQALVDTITGALKRDDSVALIGFGTFSTKNRPERIGRNPQTGKEIKIKAMRVAAFKAGKALKDALN